MRILLARIAELYGHSGGMERVEARMAQAMVERGHVVGIAHYDSIPGKPYFELPASVRLFNLFKQEQSTKGRLMAYKVIREMVRPFSKPRALYWKDKGRLACLKNPLIHMLSAFSPDVIVSFDAASSAVFFGAVQNLSVPLVTMFHFGTDSALNWKDENEVRALEKSACVQVLLKVDEQSLKQRLPSVHVVQIPNVVPQYKKVVDVSRVKERYHIINVARLAKHQKRQYLLIEAFARLAGRFPEWDVELWGKEHDSHWYTDELEELIHQNHLEGRVFLKGTTTDIYAEYLRSDIFAFPSAFEGFPLALTEAMSAGLPVIACQSCEAAREILTNGVDGLLVEDGPASLAKGLEKLMQNRNLRMIMATHGHETILQYAPQVIWNRWEDLLSLVSTKTIGRGR